MFVFLLISLLFAEVTESQRQGDSIAPSSFATCSEMENEFKNYILATIDASIEAFRTTSNCLASAGASTSSAFCRDTVSRYTSEVRRFRESQRLLFAEAVKYTVRNSPAPEFSRRCLLNSFGEPEFDNNYRDVKVQGSQIEDLGCISEENRYLGELNSVTEKIISGQIATNLSRSMLDRVKSFRQTPLHFAMSDRLKFQMNLSNDEIRQELSPVFNRFLSNAQIAKQRIAGLNLSRNYLLYDFQNQFLNWKTGLSSVDRTYAQTCYERSGFVRNCTTRTQLSRCGAQIWDVSEQMLPVFSLIDGLTSLREARENFHAQVTTSREYSEATSEALISTMLGVVEIVPSSIVARSGLETVTPIVARTTDTLADSVRLLGRRSLDLSRPIPVRGCIPRDCSVSNINMTEEAFQHVMRRHVRSELTREEVQEIIEQNQADYQALIVHYNSISRRGASQLVLDSVIKQIKDRVAADFSALKLSRNKASTHFPPGTTIESVLSTLPRTQLQRVNKNASVSIYRFQREGVEYEMVICRRPPCKVDERTVTKVDEVLTMYPLCGSNVSRFPSVANLARALVSSGQITLNQIFQFQPCSINP
jgi:hypothetical protein